MALVETIRGKQTVETIDFVLETCCNCGIPFMMPKYHRNMLYREKGKNFYCPNGHGQHFTGPTEEQKLKDEIQRLQQEKEQEREKLQNRWLDAVGEKVKLEKQLKRIHRGVCPCCNRTFQNIANHMKTKHPELVNPGKAK
jgi:hypothetical protein